MPRDARLNSPEETINKVDSVFRKNSKILNKNTYLFGKMAYMFLLVVVDGFIVQGIKQYKYLYDITKFKFEKNEHLVRIHVGLEDPKDLIADLKNSLKSIK